MLSKLQLFLPMLQGDVLIRHQTLSCFADSLFLSPRVNVSPLVAETYHSLSS